jgi:hypothetical protein
MAYTLMLHVNNADPVVGEVDELPTTSDVLIMIKNARRTDGKDIPYLAENVTIVYFPIDRLNFIEVLTTEEEDEIIGFVRE